MVKKGDTLIEVTLAVGIFSMIAIAITAVMSSGTSGAQTALETTLTREEIDTQAEALRFIQTSYAVNKNDTEGNKFYQLWHDQITGHAINLDDISSEEKRTAILQYMPNSCDDIYNRSDDNASYILDHAFVINPRQLGNFINGKSDINSVYVAGNKTTTNGYLLQPASIYPRLIYGKTEAEAEADTQSLIASSENNLYRAEGIYVLAVKDYDTTQVSGSDKKSAFYDFYIRTCWYGTDANQPSTISTVIRLHDPDAV